MIGVIFDGRDLRNLWPLTEGKSILLRILGNKRVIEHLFDLFERLGIDNLIIITKDRKIWELCREKARVLLVGDEIEALYKLLQVDDDFLLVESNTFFDLDGLDFERLKEKAMFLFQDYKIDAYSHFNKITVEKGKGDFKKFSLSGIYHFPFRITKRLEEEIFKSFDEFLISGLEEMPLKVIRGVIKRIEYPWDYLDANMYMLWKLKYWVGDNCEIWDESKIRKPVIINENCVIKNAVLEKAVIDKNCLVGEFSCVKRSVINEGTSIPHHNFLVDSIVGSFCNFGTSSNIATYKFDGSEVKMVIEGKKKGIGRNKFGAVIGDNVQLGPNVTIYPGKRIGNNVWIDGNVLVKRDIESNKFVRLKFEEGYEILEK